MLGFAALGRLALGQGSVSAVTNAVLAATPGAVVVTGGSVSNQTSLPLSATACLIAGQLANFGIGGLASAGINFGAGGVATFRANFPASVASYSVASDVANFATGLTTYFGTLSVAKTSAAFRVVWHAYPVSCAVTGNDATCFRDFEAWLPRPFDTDDWAGSIIQSETWISQAMLSAAWTAPSRQAEPWTAANLQPDPWTSK